MPELFVPSAADLGAAATVHTHAAADITSGTIDRARLPTLGAVQHNIAASVPPTVNNDSGDGYWYGSLWHDRATGVCWQCRNPAVGAAVWVALNGAVMTAPASGQWVRGQQLNALTYQQTQYALYVAPWWLPAGVSLTMADMLFEVTVAGSAGSTSRIVVITDSGDLWPQTKVWDSGSIATDTAAVKTYTGSVTLPGPVCWVGLVCQGGAATQPTIRGWAWPSGYSLRHNSSSTALLSGTVPGYVKASVFTTVPSSFTLADWVPTTAAVPSIVGKVA